LILINRLSIDFQSLVFLILSMVVWAVPAYLTKPPRPTQPGVPSMARRV